VFTIIFGLSIFCFISGIFTGVFFYEYKKNKSDLGGLVFFSILSVLLFFIVIYTGINSSTVLGKLLIPIIPTSIWLFTFFSTQKEKSILFNFFETGERLIDNLFNKLGFVLVILIIIILVLVVLFLIVKLIKFFWFY